MKIGKILTEAEISMNSSTLQLPDQSGRTLNGGSQGALAPLSFHTYFSS